MFLHRPTFPLYGQPVLSLVFCSVSVPLAPTPCKLKRFWAIWGFPLCFTVFLGLGRPCPVNYNVSELFFGSNLFLIIAKQIFNQETCKGKLGQQFLVASNIYM